MKCIPFILLLALFLQGCLADKPSAGKKSSKKSTTPSTVAPTSPTFTSDEDLYWFTSQKITGTVTVNLNSESVIYLRGKNIHNFLVSKDINGIPYYQNTNPLCVIGAFGGANKQLRLRAVPVSVNNYATKVLERVLRVDIPSRAESYAACSIATIDGVSAPSAAYALNEICPGCLGSTLITSTSLKLYQSKISATSMSQVATTLINFTSIALKIDLQSNSSSSINTCTNSSCEAKGFDCCIENQCVKDASIKSSAPSDTQYSQAMSEYAINPLNFINFPNIFNICSNIAHVPPPTTNPTNTPLGDAELRVQNYLADYKCIDQVQTTGLYSLCLPGGAILDHLAIKKKLAIACGCPSTYDDNERAVKCPDWGVRPLYKNSLETVANIVDFYCYTPTPPDPIGPITNLNVNVSNRSAPHRFYATTGINYDDPSKQASSVLQEGDDFYYLDEVNKAVPFSGSFNFNSVLGRMNVGLTQTQPAKQVTVELGRTYILSATSGYFTPCPQCAKDSWFMNFTAHPATMGGVGLRATGFSTTRDAYSANTSLGNYEDTHFGRACYVPITMIPFSHKKQTVLQTQRLNRLKTQAAFYINGYQKDWYGFNKGALIGSFDGVTWFAVGSGRRVTATSDKLYLAINASFLDLADRTDTVVNIVPDSSVSTVASYDFDPSLKITDPKQNSAGTCQKYHQCSTDADCVTQLGWEYTCADVSQMKTRWPAYDTDAKEGTNQEKIGTLFEILQATINPGDSTKRCVYRGSGAPCVRDITALNGKFNQKALTCAPNFYCASLTTNKFNEELVRSVNELDNILFGMDTNILGRPLKYVTASKSLPTEAIANIKSNGATDALGLTSAEVDDMGICRPGRSLSTIESTAHSNPDTAKRSDYISQIGSCDSTQTGNNRILSCPGFDDELNYLPTNSLAATIIAKKTQNSCGAETKHSSTFISAFTNIEGGSLQILSNINRPMLALDACYRRPGSVCHTDLDCGPNKMHENAASDISLSYFGGTEAEQNYWKESLICGQGSAVPALGSTNYSTYQLTENRCCREIGKDFTMYTSGPATLVPENMGTNVALDTKKFTIDDPKATNRYSRYTISKTGLADTTTVPSVSAGVTPAKNQWKVINETGSLTCCGGGWIRKFADGTHDWKMKKPLGLETSNFSCLNYRSPLASTEYSNFGNAGDMIVLDTYQREYDYFCKSPGQNGCMQILFAEVSGYNIIPPKLYEPSDPASSNIVEDSGYSVPAYATAAPYSAVDPYASLPPTGYTRLDTAPVGDLASGNYTFRMNQDVPYQPFAFTFNSVLPYDLYTFTDGTKKPLSFFIDKDTDYGLHLYLPAYIPFNTSTSATPSIGNVYVKYFYDDGSIEVVNITSLKETDINRCHNIARYSGVNQPIDQIQSLTNPQHESWCVAANEKTQHRPMLSVRAYTGAGRDWKYASVIIDFRPLEKLKGTVVSNPGNPYYYLTKLGKLELVGIPQITYEPIYCNSNQDKLVPGIFTSSLQTRAQFDAASFISSYDTIQSYDEEGSSVSEGTSGVGNTAAPADFRNRMAFQDKLAIPAMFSAKDFGCCTPLGKETTAASKCCSGTATTANGKMTCKLPSRTDLNVYFNKFVSSEGVGENEPAGGLIITGTEEEVDFHEYTGEPKMRSSTFQKLEELGKAYCQSKVVLNGGAFGQFPPEPYSASGYNSVNGASPAFPLSIVDSIIDSEAANPNVGKFPFDNGFRWDHHYYCK